MEDLTSAAAYYHHQSMLMMAAKQQQQQQTELLPEQEQLKCPRCDSPNTKFCYYNNYNLSQPRHYCKNCRRYWTKGGSLRNIPVGGGSRKNAKRSSSSSSSTSGNDKTVAVPDQKPSSEEESRPKSVEEERRMTGREMDPTRMLYGLPVGDPRFSSLLRSDVGMGGISYETGSNWYPGIHLGLGPGTRKDDGAREEE